MVKIFHGADFHLDTRFESLPKEKASEQRREQRRLLFEMAELVKKESVQLVLLPGDLLDSDLSYYETHEALAGALEAMAVPVFIAPGNHDYYTSRSPYSAGKIPGNVHIFTRPEIGQVTFSDLGVNVWGAAFTSPRMPSVLRGFRAPDSEMLNIMALHGEPGGDSYAPIDEKTIGDTNLDYLALGHVHTFSGIKRAGNTFYAYPGCPMGRGFDETGKKGVIIGTVDRGSVDLRFEPLSAREYRIIRAGQKELDGAIPEDGRNTVTRLILTGKWDRKPEIRRLYEKLEDRFYHLTIVDETIPDEDIWQGLGEDSLKGLFLRMMREKYDAPDADKRAILLAAEYGMAAFNNREGVEL